MDGWDIFILILAVLATFVVAMKAFFDLRLRNIERVRDLLMDAAHQGESMLAAQRLDMGSCHRWMSQASALVGRRLVRSAAASFSETTRDIMVGVELAEDRRPASAGDHIRPTPAGDYVMSTADSAAREGLKEGVGWLRRRARLLGPRDVRGRLWWLRL